MMPATQLKMLRYMRSAEPKGSGTNSSSNGPGSSPKGNSQAVNPHPPPPLAGRQQLAEAAKISLPVPLRGATPAPQSNSALPTIVSPSPKQRVARRPSVQRSRSNSDSNRPLPTPTEQQTQQQMWEDSSINSMFAESVTATARPPTRTLPNRYESPFPQKRPPQQQQQQHNYDRSLEEPTAPLMLGERGILRILPTNANGEASGQAQESYADPSPFGSPTRRLPGLKHSKYALRDTRPATRGSSFSDRVPQHGNYDDGVGSSPEQRTPHRSDNGIQDGPAMQRSAYLRDIPLGRTPARQGTDDGGSDAPSQGDEATNRTPRQLRTTPGPGPPQQAPPSVPQKRLQESSLPRGMVSGAGTGGGTGGGGGRGGGGGTAEGGRRDKKSNRKRRHSPDYDDGMLNSMSYAELQKEPFDHDPARIAVQTAAAAATVPPQLSLEERLGQYKNKDANQQHHFFTEMSLQEWDECGDWFLDQFAELSKKIRATRQMKRKKMAAFEEEIAAREQTVRSKMESIEHTLEDLKQEGEGMMRGREEV